MMLVSSTGEVVSKRISPSARTRLALNTSTAAATKAKPASTTTATKATITSTAATPVTETQKPLQTLLQTDSDHSLPVQTVSDRQRPIPIESLFLLMSFVTTLIFVSLFWFIGKRVGNQNFYFAFMAMLVLYEIGIGAFWSFLFFGFRLSQFLALCSLALYLQARAQALQDRKNDPSSSAKI